MFFVPSNLSFAFLWRRVPLWGKKGIGVALSFAASFALSFALSFAFSFAFSFAKINFALYIINLIWVN